RQHREQGAPRPARDRAGVAPPWPWARERPAAGTSGAPARVPGPGDPPCRGRRPHPPGRGGGQRADRARRPLAALTPGQRLVTQPVHRLRARVRTVAVRTFYRLPRRWRWRMVRLIQPTYTIGSVVLVHDATSPDLLLLLRQPPGAGW